MQWIVEYRQRCNGTVEYRHRRNETVEYRHIRNRIVECRHECGHEGILKQNTFMSWGSHRRGILTSDSMR